MGDSQPVTAIARRELRRDLVAIFLISLGLRFVWAVLTPPYMAPDEQAHFQYVAHLVEMKAIPHEPPYGPLPLPPNYSFEIRDSFFVTPFDDIHGQSYRGGRLRPKRPFIAVHYDYGRARSLNEPSTLRKSKAAASASAYPPFYYWLVGLGYRAFYGSPLLARLFAVRACSGVLGALICCFGYLFAYEMRRERWLARAVGLSIALLPMHTFASAAVNNDAGVALGATALSFLLARYALQHALSTTVSFGVGVSAGLMMMMKPSGVGLFGVILLVFLWRGYRALRTGEAVTYVKTGLTFTLGLVLTYGSWTYYRLSSPSLSGQGRYSQEGDLVTSVLEGKYSLLDYYHYQLKFGPETAHRVFVSSLWGNFGWREAPMPAPVYTAIIVLYALSALGWLLHARRAFSQPRSWVLPFLLLLAQFTFIFLVADYGLRFRSGGKSLGLVGRYFFPSLAPMFYMIWLGVDQLARQSQLLRRAPVIAMILLQGIGLTTYFSRWYGILFDW